jgi:hypothetical protein
MLRTVFSLGLLVFASACTVGPREAGEYGTRHSHRFQQPPEKAARCFARNAEEHSSALVSEVRTERNGSAYVTVRVKNGVTYATADMSPAGQGSSGVIVLMVRTSGRSSDLLNALVEGC